MSRNKYGNRKVLVDNILFDSEREAVRYGELKLLERAGKITGLSLQVPFVLAPSVKINGKTKLALRYFADFCYQENGVPVVEDVKGRATDVFKIKRHLMMSVHGIAIKEI